MGWTFTHKSKHQSVLDFFRERWNNDKCEVLDCAVVQRLTAYMAIRNTMPDGSKYVFAAVCLLAYRPRDEFNFGFKDMDESMEPFSYDCPERILKLLTELPYFSEHAKAWRAACWANLERRKAAPKLACGIMIKTAEPVKFNSGISESFFTCQEPRRLIFKASSGMHAGSLCRLNRKIVRAATVMSTAGAP